ncbi:MAG: response regulator [Deltaproteobacteria bacterium]|nr:response regulator [Deltaproteobacteria bacterium]
MAGSGWKLDARLFEPRGIVDAGDRHTARLLAGLSLCFVVLGACAVVAELALIPVFRWQASAQGIGIGGLALAYTFARGPRWRVGAALLAAVPILAASAALWADPGDLVAPAFMILGVVFAAFFLRLAHAAAMAAATFALLLVLIALHPELQEPARCVPLVVLHLIASPCLLWAAAHRERVERLRREALVDEERARAEHERLEVVGRLASGVAHDFNNMLSVIRVDIDVLVESAAASDRPLLDEMRQVCDRGAALIQTLLAFARKAPVEPQWLDLHEAVGHVSVLVSRLLGEHITLRVQHTATAPLVRAAPSQVEQIVMNLVLNARDALEQKGTITVATDVVDGGARLTVSDTGVGMTPETARRMFEPFFTTKATGTGLGLATVHSLVTQLGATIDVQSAPGAGTVVTVTFPTPPHQAAAHAPTGSVAARSVLVVDDDELVRRLIQRVLEADGHIVRVASSGTDALQALEAHRDTTVLVTDVSMPGMSGPQLVQNARALAPQIRVLYVSAMPDRDHAVRHGDAVLAKPFAPHALRAAIGAL